MSEIIELVLEYVAIWLPSIMAAGGIVYTVLAAISKTAKALEEFKKSDEIKELKNVIQEQSQKLEIQQAQLDIIIDELTKIKDYRESRG